MEPIDNKPIPKVYDLPITLDRLSPQAKALKDEIQAPPRFFKNASAAIKAKVTELADAPDQALAAICAVFQEELENNPNADPMKLIEKLSASIPFETLQAAAGMKNKDLVDALKKAKSMITEAKLFFEDSQKGHSPTMRGRVKTVFYAILNVLDSIISTFSVGELFKKPESESQKQYRSQKIMMLLGVISMLMAFLIPTLGPKLGGLIVGGFFVSVTAISIVYPYIKGMPESLPKGQNWTYLDELGELDAIHTQMALLRKISNALRKCKTENKFPLLAGITGSGKTSTIKSFVKALKKFPEHEGKEVHYFNCATLAGVKNSGGDIYGNETNPLTIIDEAMGRKRGKIILVLDEIHALYADKTSVIAQELKSKLDPGQKGFPQVIALTTSEEYAYYIQERDPAFDRRFTIIKKENANAKETVVTLAESCAKKDSNTLIEDNSLLEIFTQTAEKFPDKAQPLASLEVLNECLNRTNISEITEEENKLDELDEEDYTLARLSGAGQKGFLEKDEMLSKTSPEKIAVEIQNNKNNLKDAKEELLAFNRKRRMVTEVKRGIYQGVEKLSKIRGETIPNGQKEELNKFILIKGVFLPVLEDYLVRKAKKMKVKVRIDKDLVKDVIREEVNKRYEAKELADQARRSMAARKKNNSKIEAQVEAEEVA